MNPNATSVLARCLKKVGLHGIVSPRMFNASDSNVDEERYKLSLSRLNSVSPDNGKSAVRKEPAKISYEYDLHIIVPTYNEERNIAKCLDSIIENKTDYRVLTTVINDGSTDNTKNILLRYLERPDIEVINQDNQGLSGARNRGIEILRGRFIMFVDSDDSLPKGSINNLLNKSIASQADIIGGGYLVVDQHDHIISEYTPLSTKQHGYPWGKIYKASLFRDVHFPGNYWFEDTLIGMIIDKLAAKTDNVSEPVYRYLDNQNGITHKSEGNKRVLDTFYVTRQLLRDRETLGMKMTDSFYHDLLWQVKMNQRRISTLRDMIVNEDIFTATRYLLSHYPAFKASDKRLELLEWSLRNNNFNAYIMACV